MVSVSAEASALASETSDDAATANGIVPRNVLREMTRRIAGPLSRNDEPDVQNNCLCGRLQCKTIMNNDHSRGAKLPVAKRET